MLNRGADTRKRDYKERTMYAYKRKIFIRLHYAALTGDKILIQKLLDFDRMRQQKLHLGDKKPSFLKHINTFSKSNLEENNRK